jgi:putative ABC transport system permease protein
MRQDLVFALRTLRKNRAFAAAAVLTLALGIGANSAMFTVIRAVLLKPLAYRDPDRVVLVSGHSTIARFEETKAAQQSYSDFGDQSCCPQTVTLSGPDGPEPLKQARVSANFLDILGVQPLIGRGFLPEEDTPAGPRAAMISEGLWHSRFQGDPSISGKTAILGLTAYTIVGVLPRGFDFPFSGADVWVTHPAENVNAASTMLQMFARLKPGVGIAEATAELAVLNQHYRTAHPGALDAKADAKTDAKPDTNARVVPLKEDLVSGTRSRLWVLAGAVGFVLLIACANVAGLLLARAAARSREFAVRAALGAPRLRLIRQLLVESVLVASAGGALGLLLANWSLRWISTATALELPRAGEIRLDVIVLGFTAAISVATGVLFGMIPALGASRPDLAAVLRASGEAAAASGRRRFGFGLSARGVLVVAQVALSMILLTGAALLMQSVSRMRGVDPGFNPSNLLTMRISLPESRYGTVDRTTAFYSGLVQRIEGLPGVRGAAVAFTLPFTGYAMTPIQPADQTALPLNQRLLATVQAISPDYFRTLQIPLRRGRELTERDDANAPLTVVINESLARKLWPAYPDGANPVGLRVLIGNRPEPVQIAGIVADAHVFLEMDALPAMYRPLAQNPNPQQSSALAIRTEGDPLHFVNAVRAQVQAMDRDQAVTAVQSMQDLEESEIGPKRAILTLLGSFAAVALLLALTGIYGIIAYSVVQRTPEVGIRRALGAGQTDILRLVIGQGLILTVAGIAIGIAGGLALTRFLKSLLFETSPVDTATFAGVAILFLAVALAASYIPARRAARIDPMAALR